MSDEYEYNSSNFNEEKMYMGAVKIGVKGQIVIPKEVRDIFGLKPGDSLLLLADINRGIALQHYDVMKTVMNAAFNAHGSELPPIPGGEEEDKK